MAHKTSSARCSKPHLNKHQLPLDVLNVVVSSDNCSYHLSLGVFWSLSGAVCACATDLRLRDCGGVLVVVIAKQQITGCGVGSPCTSVAPRCIHSKRRDKNRSKQ